MHLSTEILFGSSKYNTVEEIIKDYLSIQRVRLSQTPTGRIPAKVGRQKAEIKGKDHLPMNGPT
ncbi:hypothetical protein HPB48_010065 [Haemaphysalis longicornis]|uniref:Uncharacterized protein n=1 Tax=Haemaphysalis longicornis TaxID=44386 RepID=A0A9J6GV99_HAELO|nr:hypothetical protein HPB48_010065 [Haemaphysalis longicornis]